MKKYETISPHAYHTDDADLIARILTERAYLETVLSGLCVSVSGEREFNFVISFSIGEQIEACWTPINAKDPGPCESIAAYVSRRLGRDMNREIMGRCYQVLKVCTNPVTVHLLATHKTIVSDLIGL